MWLEKEKDIRKTESGLINLSPSLSFIQTAKGLTKIALKKSYGDFFLFISALNAPPHNPPPIFPAPTLYFHYAREYVRGFHSVCAFGFESLRFSAAVLAHFSYPLLACQGVIVVPQSC